MGWPDKKTLVKALQYLVTIIILLAICYYINISTLIDALLRINILFLLLAVFCYFLNNLLMSYRLKKLIYWVGHKIRFKLVFFSHMSGMLLSDFTPARSGYLYTAYALNKYGIPLNKCMASITSTYLYDFIFKVLIGLLGLYYFYSYIYSPSLGAPLLITIFFIMCVILGYAAIMYPPGPLKSLLRKFALSNKILEFGQQSRSIQKYSIFILTITFMGWVLRGLQWFFVALSIGGGILSIVDSLFLNPLLSLLSFAPITPGGLGIQEAGIVGFLTFMGINGTIAITFAFMVRSVEIFTDLLGIRGLLSHKVDTGNLLKFYNTIDGDADEKAYNSDLLVQSYWQRRKTATMARLIGVKKGDIVVDIGCGSGVQIRELCKNNPKMAIGIDMNMNALRYASQKNMPNTAYIMADAGHLPIKPDCIDKIVCCEIIEHLMEPEKLIGEVNRVIKHNGEVVITTPNEHSIWGAYEIMWDVFGRGRNYGDTHLKFFSRKELERIFNIFHDSRASTIFFISPVFALFNNKRILEIGSRIDRTFEKYHFGVLLVFHAKRTDK